MDGFYGPAEEAPHEFPLMQWPVDLRVYENRWFLEAVHQTIVEITNAIADFEPVLMLAEREHHAQKRKTFPAKLSYGTSRPKICGAGIPG